MKEYFFVGTYTEPILFGTGEVFKGKGEGIYLCRFEDGQIQVLSKVSTRNPSYLCVDEDRQKIYAVNELKEYNGAFGGGLVQVEYRDGSLQETARFETCGTDPCHVAAAPNGRFISVANFASGAITVFELDNKGNLTGERTLFQHKGSSADPKRQQGPHAHSTIFLESENLMFIPDLGLDAVKAYRYEGSTVRPAPEFDFRVSAGCGPRTGEFTRDGKYFYLINELSSQVMCFACSRGMMTAQGCVETLPDGVDKTANICSDLHITPDGRFLYASNRGHDSLCCYAIEENGGLRRLYHIPCGGRTPRNFAIDPAGQYLLVGNQDSDTISVFEILRDGQLEPRGTAEFPSPVCIRFLNGAGFGVQ
ncbi:MAG: lactonase family protein [Oscillospiraceae bacterium]